jgi:hypothetical protein
VGFGEVFIFTVATRPFVIPNLWEMTVRIIVFFTEGTTYVIYGPSRRRRFGLESLRIYLRPRWATLAPNDFLDLLAFSVRGVDDGFVGDGRIWIRRSGTRLG